MRLYKIRYILLINFRKDRPNLKSINGKIVLTLDQITNSLHFLCDWHFLNRSMKNGSLVYIIYFILIINLAQNKLEKESILLVTIHEDQLLVILLLILYWIAKRNRLFFLFYSI